jgi:hypothetical protein
MQCSTPPFPLTWLSRVVKPSPHLARAGHLQSQFTARFSLLAYAIVRYDVFASPPVQVPTHIVHIRSFQSHLDRRCYQSPLLATPLDFLTTSTRPALTRVRANVRLHQRLHHLFSFPPRHSLPSSLPSFTPYKNRPAVSVSVLLTNILALRLTSVVCDSFSSINPSIAAQSTARCSVIRTCSFPTSRHCIHSRSRSL